MFRLAAISFVGAILSAYFIGCLTTGYYLALFATGQDIRDTGSGGTGARNVGRLLGRRAAFLTILGDGGKGILAVALADVIASNALVTLCAVLAATAGHIWPIQLGFRGGKGVATSLGALAVWSPLSVILFAGVFVVSLFFSRKATLSAVVSYASLPLSAAGSGHDAREILLLAMLSGTIIYLHRRAAYLELQADPTN